MPQPLLYQVLYVSTLSPELPLSVVADIAHHARARNAAHGITSLLAFDGQRFCQLLEGERRPVLSLAERIRSDPRHAGVEVLHHGPLQARRFSDFQLAFTSGEEGLPSPSSKSWTARPRWMRSSACAGRSRSESVFTI